MEGSTLSLSKCDFSRLFHTERSWHTYRFTVVFVSGRQDLPSDEREFSLTRPSDVFGGPRTNARLFVASSLPHSHDDID